MNRRTFLKVGGGALAAALLGTTGALRQAAAAPANLTFQADDSLIRNPERGWYRDLLGNWNINEEKWHIRDELAGLRDAHNVTLFRRYFLLDDYLNSDIPQRYLDAIEQLFNDVRAVGCKIIPRFRYTWNTRTLNRMDGSLSRILGHMDQVIPICLRHNDIIDHYQPGWVGYWGEWHTSKARHVSGGLLTASGKRIAHEMMDRTPKDRQMAFRYPRHVRQLFGSNAPTLENAYTGTDRARVGFSNDGASRDPQGWNTFTQRGDRELVGAWGRYSIQAGEPAQSTRHAMANFYSETKWFGFHCMNMNQPDPALYELYQTMRDNGNHDNFHRYLGHRYRLVSATVEVSATPGQPYRVSFKFANDGWNRSHNERRLVLVLRHKATGQKFEFEYTERDVRLALPGPGGTSTITMNPTVPADAPEGAYDVILWLPDPYDLLRTRPEYAIRLANVGTWEASTGYNVVFGDREVSVT